LTATIKFISTVDSKLSQLDIQNGQLIFVSDTRKIYLDFNGIRTEYSQIIPLAKEEDRLNYLSPITGFYFVKETAILWCVEQGNWIQITSKPKEWIVFTTYDNLPKVGISDVLYVTETQSYRWTSDGYIRLGCEVWEPI
jgi:hypothetical protein